MPAEAVHATAVAIGGEGLLILGPSRSGKSRLALSLIAASRRGRRICLVGDDRILLDEAGGGLVARGHPRIAGFIECRELGILAVPHVRAAPLAAVVTLGPGPTHLCLAKANFPTLSIVNEDKMRDRGDRVLQWWTAHRGCERRR